MAYDDEKKIKRASTKTSSSKNYHISSINFKKSRPHQAGHNDRTQAPSYLIGGDYEVNLNSSEALELKEKMIKEAKEAYFHRTKKKFQAKSYEWSAVCNITPETTMEDLERLAKHFNQKYGFQCYQIAIHRDEGHINEKGEKVINHHAHLEFVTLEKDTGLNKWQRRHIGQNTLRQIQTEVAEILGMQRGEPSDETGVKRIEPRKYAQLKEQEKKKIAQLTQELENSKKRGLELEQPETDEKIKKENETLKKIISKINDRDELTEIEKNEIESGKIDFLIDNLKTSLKNRVITEYKINERKQPLNQKNTKNEELVEKKNKMDLSGNSVTQNDKELKTYELIFKKFLENRICRIYTELNKKQNYKLIKENNQNTRLENIEIFKFLYKILKENNSKWLKDKESNSLNFQEILERYEKQELAPKSKGLDIEKYKPKQQEPTREI